MTDLEIFLKNPTKQTSYFLEYNNSFWGLPASPEYSMGEVCLASLMRSLGSNVKEKTVYSNNSQKGSEIRNYLENKWLDFAQLHDVKSNLFNMMKSPLAGQSPKNPLEYLNLYPIIPQFSFVSNSARFGGNPWNPAEFIKGMIATGSPDLVFAKNIWNNLFEALSVTDSDDLWANILNNIFSTSEISNEDFHWKERQFNDKIFEYYSLPIDIFNQKTFPAKSFCGHIAKLIELKKITTRRQWISIFESFLRISIGTHLIWLCKLNIRLWNVIWQENEVDLQVLRIRLAKIFDEIVTLELDMPSDPILRRICGDYAEARIGINLIAHYYKSNYSLSVPKSFSDLETLAKWISSVKSNLSLTVQKSEIKGILLELLSQNPKIQQGSASFSKNMFEFLKHSLGQKATADPKERNFDQSYWSIKNGYSRNALWITKLGPVSVICVVALATSGKSGTASDITAFLANLGIVINPDKLLVSSLGESLIDLGLTTDNPDGEKGVIILNPFQA